MILLLNSFWTDGISSTNLPPVSSTHKQITRLFSRLQNHSLTHSSPSSIDFRHEQTHMWDVENKYKTKRNIILSLPQINRFFGPSENDSLGHCCGSEQGGEIFVRSHLSGSNRPVDVAIPAIQHDWNGCFSSDTLSCSACAIFRDEQTSARPQGSPQLR